MKYMFIALSFAFLVLPLSHVYADSKTDLLSLLASAKITGTCEVMDQMIEFQETNQIPGGDAFIAEFQKSESQRKKISEEEMSEYCNTAVMTFTRMWNTLIESAAEAQ